MYIPQRQLLPDTEGSSCIDGVQKHFNLQATPTQKQSLSRFFRPQNFFRWALQGVSCLEKVCAWPVRKEGWREGFIKPENTVLIPEFITLSLTEDQLEPPGNLDCDDHIPHQGLEVSVLGIGSGLLTERKC